MKYFISAMLLMFSFAPLAAQADMIPDGEHAVSTYVSIDNASSYPEYSFYLGGGTHIGGVATQTLAVDDNQQINLVGKPTLQAFKKSDKAKIVSGEKADCPECGDNWFELDANKSIVIPSGLSVEIASSVPDANRTASVHYVLHIDGIEKGQMRARIASTTMYDAENKILSVVSGSSPADAQSSALSLIWVVIVCMGAAIVLLAVKTWKK